MTVALWQEPPWYDLRINNPNNALTPILSFSEGTGQTVDWLIEVPPRQGAPPILRWRSSLAG